MSVLKFPTCFLPPALPGQARFGFGGEFRQVVGDQPGLSGFTGEAVQEDSELRHFERMLRISGQQVSLRPDAA